MTKPKPCNYCITHSERFNGATGVIPLGDQVVPYSLVWVCDYDNDFDDDPIHGPLIIIQPPDETTGDQILQIAGAVATQ